MHHTTLFWLVYGLAQLHLSLAYRIRVNQSHNQWRGKDVDSDDQQQLLDGREPSSSDNILNSDRLECLRQDNLDLLYPSDPKHIVRQVLPVNNDDTFRDIYIVAEEIHIKNFNAKVKFGRKPGTKHLTFSIYGDNSHVDSRSGILYSDCASADFKVKLDVQTRSTMLDWAASLAADRKQLSRGQDASLNFKLSGMANAVVDDEDSWELRLKEPEAIPFDFQITDQYIVQTALNKYGGIDKLVMDKLFPVIRKAIPVSLVAAFNYLESEDLGFAVELVVEGSQTGPTHTLNLDITLVKADIKLDFTKMIGSFVDHFDFKKIAVQKADDWLQHPASQEIWDTNKPLLIQTLEMYGWLTPTIVAKIKEVDKIQEIRDDLIDAVEGTADYLYKSLHMFMEGYKKGMRMSLDGFKLGLNLSELHWDAKRNNGLIQARVVAPDEPESAFRGHRKTRERERGTTKRMNGTEFRKVLEMPNDILDFFGIAGLLNPPKSGASEVKLNGLSTRGRNLTLSHISFSQVFKLIYGGNGTADSIYKLDGEARDLYLTLPKSMTPPVYTTLTANGISLGPDGHIVLYVDGNGLEFRQAPKDPNAPVPIPYVPKRLLRSAKAQRRQTRNKGDAKMRIDGPLPRTLSRHSQPYQSSSLLDIAPLLDSYLDIVALGAGRHMALNTSSSANVKVNLRGILSGALAGRPAFDFGYVFFAERLERRVEGDQRGLNGLTVVVVSCGYLRLIPRSLRGDVNLLAFEPASGFLQIDLTQYLSIPEIVPDSEGRSKVEKSGRKCLLLYSGGLQPREVGRLWTRQVTEFLCGPNEKIKKLQDAISLQIYRFKDPRAETWNFGTHNAEKEQFLLPRGEVSVDLAAVVGTKLEAGSSTVLTELAANSDAMTADDGASGAETADTAPAESPLGDRKRKLVPATNAKLGVGEGMGKKRRGQANKPNLDVGRKQQVVAKRGQGQSSPSGLWRHRRRRTASWQRAQCKAAENLDRLYFPPEMHPNTSIRLAVGPYPVIGMCYITINEIQVTMVELSLEIGRTGDDEFDFQVGGLDRQEKAKVRAFVQGLAFTCPDSHLDDAARYGAKLTNYITRVLTLNFVRDYSRLDKFPVDIDFRMSGNCQVDENGHWLINQQKAQSDASIAMDKAGPFLEVVNLLTDIYGGMDQIFLDTIFPLIIQLIPPKAAEAFRKVSYDHGRIRHRLHVQGWCENALGRRCPSQELTFRVTDATRIFMNPEPVLKTMVQPGGFLSEHGTLKTAVDGILDVYSESGVAFKGFQTKLDFEADLLPNRTLKSGSRVIATVPFDVIGNLVGAGLKDFIPLAGAATQAVGSLKFKEGILRVPEMEIKNLQLPLATALGKDNIMLGMRLDNLAVERIEGPEDTSGLSIWQKDSVLDAHIQSLGLVVSRDHGAQTKGGNGTNHVEFSLSPKFVTGLLANVSARPVVPERGRSGNKNFADGKVPDKFERPFSQEPAKLDASRLIKDLKMNITITTRDCSNGRCSDETKRRVDNETHELLDAAVKLSLFGHLKLDSSFYDGVIRTSYYDTGYLSLMIPGRYGQLDKSGNKPPKRTAIAHLTCGSLEIYEVSQAQAKAYKGVESRRMIERARYIEMDLAYEADSQILFDENVTSINRRYKCIRVKKVSDLSFWADGYRHFCGLAKDIENLWEAMLLQRKRFQDNKKAFARVKHLKKLYSETGNEPMEPVDEATAGVDGTWFRKLDPYDSRTFPPMRIPPSPLKVVTPNQMWAETLGKLQ